MGELQEGHSLAGSGAVSTWLPRLRPPVEVTLPRRWTTWVKRVAPADGGSVGVAGGAVTAWGTGMLSMVWGERGDPHAELQ